jgi:hypothetical protein
LALAACQSVPPAPPPASEDLRGLWEGTWGGTPLSLLVTEHRDLEAPSGIFVGPFQVLGQARPGVVGILTYTQRGEALSVNFEGRLGGAGAARTLVIIAHPTSGRLQLSLRRAEDRLAGAGESEFWWGPRGPVELRRR